MSESDADDSVDASEEVIYPVDGKFYSEKDKAEIMAMTEIERETILAERAQELERRTQDLQLRQRLQDRERQEAAAEKRKRKASAIDSEDSPRKSTRQKVKTHALLENYKKERQQRGQQRLQRGNLSPGKERRKGNNDNQSDVDADGDSEVEWDSGKPSKAATIPEEPPAELKDFERIRVGRSNFAKVCFYPGFEEAINGCYCRVSIGVDKVTGQNIYRMAQVKGIYFRTLFVTAC